MNHDELRQRRHDIAEFVRKGGDESDACQKFEVSLATVHTSMKEFGVRSRSTLLQGMKLLKPVTYRILRDLFDGVEPMVVSRKYNVAISSVCRIRDTAEVNGWPEVMR